MITCRYVLDDQYTSSGGTKFPIKWAPPEVLNYTRFSSKSDVWAYGVLMWEVFTCGKMPYGRLKNTEVVERVQRGIILERPKACFKEVYEVSHREPRARQGPSQHSSTRIHNTHTHTRTLLRCF